MLRTATAVFYEQDAFVEADADGINPATHRSLLTLTELRYILSAQAQTRTTSALNEPDIPTARHDSQRFLTTRAAVVWRRGEAGWPEVMSGNACSTLVLKSAAE